MYIHNNIMYIMHIEVFLIMHKACECFVLNYLLENFNILNKESCLKHLIYHA